MCDHVGSLEIGTARNTVRLKVRKNKGIMAIDRRCLYKCAVNSMTILFRVPCDIQKTICIKPTNNKTTSFRVHIA